MHHLFLEISSNQAGKDRDAGKKHQEPEDKSAEDGGIKGTGASQGIYDFIRDIHQEAYTHQNHRDGGQKQRNQNSFAEQAFFQFQSEDGEELAEVEALYVSFESVYILICHDI